MRAPSTAAVLAMLAMTACQTAYQGNENSPYYVVPAGSRLVLNREITFQPGQLSVYVQNGQILRANQAQHYDPFCKFELYHQLDAARTLAPDDITITRAYQQRWDGTYSQSERSPNVRVGAVRLAQMGGDGGVPLMSFLTTMDLHSDKQPEIFRMTCLRWAYLGQYTHDEHPSVSEIRATLSPLFTLRLPGESG